VADVVADWVVAACDVAEHGIPACDVDTEVAEVLGVISHRAHGLTGDLFGKTGATGVEEELKASSAIVTLQATIHSHTPNERHATPRAAEVRMPISQKKTLHLLTFSQTPLKPPQATNPPRPDSQVAPSTPSTPDQSLRHHQADGNG
jgi:hypothetical protein